MQELTQRENNKAEKNKNEATLDKSFSKERKQRLLPRKQL